MSAKRLLVLKFGGALAEDDAVIRSIAEQARTLRRGGAGVVVVHGGGRQIDAALAQSGLTPQRDPSTGLRLTDRATLAVSDQALRTLNTHIKTLFREVAGAGDGFAGYDGHLVSGRARAAFTGEPSRIDAMRVSVLARHGLPIFYPVCSNEAAPPDGETRLNVNADDVAAALAAGLAADHLVLCSDIPGVLDHNGAVIPRLSVPEIELLIEDGVATGGMIAKLRGAARVAAELKGGVAIIDGRRPGAILSCLAGQGGGTLIVPG